MSKIGIAALVVVSLAILDGGSVASATTPSSAPSAGGAWTADTALPAGSSLAGAGAIADPAGGSLLFYVLNNTPTIAVVAGNGAVKSSAAVPAISGLNNSGTPRGLAFLPTGGAIATWTLTAYGTSYMAYRSPAGVWATPVQLPSGYSNLAVRAVEVLISEASGTGISTESWTLSPNGALALGSGPTNVYTGQPLFGQSWLAIDAAGTAQLVVYGSTDNGNSEAVGSVTRSAAGQWSTQTQLSATGVYVQSVHFATSPGGRSIVSWVTGNTALAASSYTSLRRTGQAFGSAVATGSDASSNGAYIFAIAAAGPDGTVGVAVTQRIYTTGTAFTSSTAAYSASPTATALSGPVSVPVSVPPASLGAGNGELIAGSVAATYGAGNPSYPSSYTAAQQVVATIIGPGSTTTSHQLGSSSGLYDGNGGDGCGCPTSPPTASITGVALDAAGNGVAVGQLTPGGVLESARFVASSAPSAPRHLQASPGHAVVNLSWTAPASHGSSRIMGYNVYAGTKSGVTHAQPVNASPLAPTARGYSVTTLTNGTTYFFIVKAINAVGSGAPSNKVSATPS